MNKLAQARMETRRSVIETKGTFMKMKDTMSTPTKIQSNPEYLYFDSLKSIFDPSTYKTLIKMLHIYNEVR